MAVFKKDVLLFLVLLLSFAEATDLSNPMICYVLDAVLLFYCIIFTALYFKLKLDKAKTFVIAQNKSQSMDKVQEEEQYQALAGQSNDDYQEIQTRKQPRKKKSKSKQPKSKSSGAEAIEMKPTLPLPARD